MLESSHARVSLFLMTLVYLWMQGDEVLSAVCQEGKAELESSGSPGLVQMVVPRKSFTALKRSEEVFACCVGQIVEVSLPGQC